LAPDEYPASADLERAVDREQLCDVAPLVLVDVIAVGALQDLDLALVLQLFDHRFQARQLPRTGASGHAAAGGNCRCGKRRTSHRMLEAPGWQVHCGPGLERE